MLTLIRSWRFAGIVAAAGALGTGAYAFAASNTVPTSYAGSGNGTISGFTVSAVVHHLDSSNAIDYSTFTLNQSATTVKAKLVAAGSTYTACTIASGTSATCTYGTPVVVATADQLDVIATS